MTYKCKKCGHITKKKKRYCPKCGQDLKKDRHKRICKYFILCSILLILCFTGFLFLQQKRAEYTVNDFLTAYKNADGEKCGELLYNNVYEEEISFSELQKLLAEKMSWKIKQNFFQRKKDGEVEIRIKNIDFEEIAKEFEGRQVTEEGITAAISDAKADKSYDCKVTVNKYGKEYKIIMTDTFSNALFGGLNEYLQKNVGYSDDKD